MHADPIVKVYGLFEAGELRGAMRLYDFTMRLHGVDMLVGGVGGVAVDLLHKKAHIAYDMLQFFQAHYREKGAALTTLYPFRPDFYRQMGSEGRSAPGVRSLAGANAGQVRCPPAGRNHGSPLVRFGCEILTTFRAACPPRWMPA